MVHGGCFARFIYPRAHLYLQRLEVGLEDCLEVGQPCFSLFVGRCLHAQHSGRGCCGEHTICEQVKAISHAKTARARITCST